MRNLFLAASLLLAVLISGCTGTLNTVVSPNANLKSYKTAYVEMLKQDEFNLGSAIMAHMMDMGFAVKPAPLPADVLTTDLLIKYDYYDGWDFRKYLKSFNIQFLEAKTNAVIITTHYDLTGIWRGDKFRIDYTFNDIRLKTGYPPLKDFVEE